MMAQTWQSGPHSAGQAEAPSPPARNRGPAEPIGYAIASSTLGPVLVAASGQGLCAVTIGDEPEELIADLRQRFPSARLERQPKDAAPFAARIVTLIEQPHIPADVPLDIRGTLFQRAVWAALTKIPLGSTASYSEIALRIGRPAAVRAVAGACAANHLAVVIPCHRVVRSDGALSGYRWGLERKRALLARERAASS